MNFKDLRKLLLVKKLKTVIIVLVQQQKLNVRPVKQVLVEMQRAAIVRLVGFKICQGTPRAVSVQMDGETPQQVLRHAMVFLPDPTVGMVEYENVKQVIIVMVRQPIKQNVYPDRMLQKWDPFHALNVRQERMQDRLAWIVVTSVAKIHINQTPIVPNAFQFRKVTTNQAQRQK